MISNVQEPQGGTAWSVPILGCCSRREQVGSSQKKGKTQGGTWLRLEKLWSRCQNQRTLPCSSPGPGEQMIPQGHWSSMARQGPHEVSAHREEP